MKRRNQLDFGIVDRCRINFPAGAGRQAAEEIHNAAAPYHGESLLPGGWIARRFDHGIGAESVLGERFHGGYDILRLGHVERRHPAPPPVAIERRRAPGYRNNTTSAPPEPGEK